MGFDRAAYSDLYPFASQFLDRGGLKLHYVDEGPRPGSPGADEPVVMVHGNPTWSFYYRNVVLALRATNRCVVPDHMGCGLSDKPGDDRYSYTLDSRVADLGALIDHLGLGDRITLVCHDWGGMIGLAWATRNPGRVARVVVLNTSGFRLPSTKRLPATLWLVRNVTPFGALAVRGFNAFAGLATSMAVAKPLDPRVAAGLVAPYDSWANRIATQRFVQDIPLAPGDPAWSTVVATEDGLAKLAAKPILIGWGEKDFVFDGHFLAEWRRRFPGAEYHVYPDAGHYVLEDAKDDLIPRIAAFVRRPLAATSSGAASATAAGASAASASPVAPAAAAPPAP